MINILIVDDDPAILEITKMFLERTGNFVVSTGESAAEGLVKLEEDDFDVVISDYEMPGMNGLDFLKMIRNKGNSIPFVIFTGRSREEVVIEALNCGADYYIQKGGEPKALFAELTHKALLAVGKRRSEKALADANEYKDRLIEAHIDPLLTIDRDYRIMDMNSAMENLSGYAREEIEGDEFEGLFSGGRDVRAVLDSALEKRCIRDYPMEVLDKSGNRVPVLLHATPYLDENNSFRGFFTEFHEMKDVHTESFPGSADNSELYLDILMHDIRNMITVEKGYLEVIGDHAEEEKMWKRRMDNLTGNIGHLINNVDVMKRADESGHNLKTVEIKDLIRKEAGNFSDLDIIIEDFDYRVSADELLGSVFYNLFNNVKKHCDTGTKVKISATENDGHISILFEDFGKGIPTAVIERFNKESVYTGDHSGGKGLGLILIKTIIGNCGGKIIISSKQEESVGTKYIISLKKNCPYEESIFYDKGEVCLKNR